MKLKVLGMCAIASLLYGENVFANVASTESEEQLQDLIDNNTTTTQDKNLSVSENITNYNTNIMQNSQNRPVFAKNKKNARRNEKRRASVQSDLKTPQANQNLDNGTVEVTVLETLDMSPQNDIWGNSKEAYAAPNYKVMADNIENQFSKFKNSLDDFKLTANSFFNNTLDNPNLSAEERRNSANFFNEAKKNIITEADSLNSVLNEASNILKIFENLKIDEKIQEVKAYEIEIEKLINNINEKRKSQKRQKKQDKQASKQIIGEIDWSEIDKYYTENLSKFALKARDFKFKFGDIMYYGGKCFENQDGSMFNPQQEMDPSLRPLCAQIFKVHFPAAHDAYFKIKEMDKKDKTQEVLEDFRSKILALGGSVASLINQKSGINEKKIKDEEDKKKMEEAIKRENLGEGNGYEE